MTNIYFPDEKIQKDDVYFICYMVERVARRIHQKNSYIVNKIGKKQLEHLISVANVLHSENPKSVEDDWIEEYQLEEGNVDVTDVDKDLVDRIPTALQMGKVYQRLISDTMQMEEICEVLDNYNASAYYEPSYVIARAYQNGGF